MKGLKNLLAITLSLVCLGFIFYYAGPEVIAKFSTLHLIDVFLVTVLIIICFLIALFRFGFLLSIFDHRPAFREVLLAFSIGQISNQYLLNIVGQSLSRAVILSRAGVPFSTTVMLTYVERMLSAGILFTAAICSAWVVFLHIGLDMKNGGEYLIYVIVALAIVTLINAALIYKTSTANSILPRDFIRFRKIWPAIILTIAAHLSMLAAYLLILSNMMDLQISIEIIAAFFIVMFAASLPISFSGWGIRELSAAATLGMVGVEPAVAITVSIFIGLVSQFLSLAFVPVSIFLSTGINMSLNISQFSDMRKNINIDSWQKIIIKACVLFCATFIFFQIWLPVGDNKINVNFADVIALTGLGIVLFDLFIRQKFEPYPRILIAALAIVSMVLLSSLLLGYLRFGPVSWSIYNRGIGWLVILGYVAMGGAILIASEFKGQVIVLKALISSAVTIVVLQLVLAILMFSGHRIFSKHIFNLPLEGFANNANAFSFQLVMVLIATIVANRLGLYEKKRWLFYTVLGLLGLANYYTYSRAGYIIFFLVLLLMLFTVNLYNRKNEIYALLVSTVSFFSGKLVPLLISSNVFIFGNPENQAEDISKLIIKQNQINYDSDHARWLTVKDGILMWLDHPVFGSGLGGYIHKQLETGDNYIVIHSIPVWLLAETGLTGFIVISAIFIALLVYAFKKLGRPEDAVWGFGLLSILVCIGVAGLVHDFFYQRIFWFMLGLFMVSRPLHQNHNHNQSDIAPGYVSTREKII